MTPIRETKKFTIYVYGSVVAVTSLAVLASNAVVPWPDWMSIARALGSGALVAYLLSIVVDRWLWRIQPFKTWFGMPDFGGRWERLVLEYAREAVAPKRARSFTTFVARLVSLVGPQE